MGVNYMYCLHFSRALYILYDYTLEKFYIYIFCLHEDYVSQAY